MTDIDFDELDRAVSSIMSTKAPANDEQPEKVVADEESSKGLVEESTEEQTIELGNSDTTEAETSYANDTAEVATETPEVVSSAEVAETKEDDTEEPTASVVVAKKRGQFMDVMHPSADMRTRPAPVSVARRSTVLKPSAKFEKSFSDSESQVKEAPIDTVARSADWPDSVDLAASDIPEVTAVSDASESENQTPLVSPFLPDAKPEKRPLGSVVSNDVDLPTEPDEIEEAADSSFEPEVIEPASIAVPMPEELGSDIMNVESGSMPLAANAAAPSPVQPIEEPDDSSRPSGPSSIPQQYKTSEPPVSIEHAALYDTSSQQDVMHPAKKRSGWLIPLIIIILLILGGAGGYFVYTTHIFG